jgi:hypothetical protein
LSGLPERYSSAPLVDVFAYEPEWPNLSATRRHEIERLVAR